MLRRALTLLALFATTTSTAAAQSFVEPAEALLPKEGSWMELVDGTRVEGKFAGAAYVNGTIRKVSFTAADGTKMKLEAVEVKRLGIKLTKLAKFAAMSDASSTIVGMAKTNWEEIANREFAVFQQALLPTNKDKYALLQILNAGFDSRVQVYQDPNAAETAGVGVGGMQITGGDDRSFIVVKDAAKSMLVKKPKYKEQFVELFGDCPQLMAADELKDAEKVRFKDFAVHTFVYDQLCGTGAKAPTGAAEPSAPPAAVPAAE